MRKYLKLVIPVAGDQRVSRSAGRKNSILSEHASSELKSLAAIANNAWKAKTKMLDSATGEVREDMKRVYRHIEGILESLQEIGIEIREHTGDAFDYGLPLNVVTTQPTPGITKEKVIETIKPTVYWQKQIIQMGEVVVATPVSSQEKP